MNKHTQEPTQRQLRLAEQIRHILAKVLVRGDIRDPSLAGKIITVTEVRLSPDLQRATVFVCRLGRSDVDELLPALKRAAPYMRRRVAHALPLKTTPELRFAPDRAFDYSAKIHGLLRAREMQQDEEWVLGARP